MEILCYYQIESSLILIDSLVGGYLIIFKKKKTSSFDPIFQGPRFRSPPDPNRILRFLLLLFLILIFFVNQIFPIGRSG